MDGNYLANPLVFLVTTLFGLYATAVLLRFLLLRMQSRSESCTISQVCSMHVLLCD